MEIDRGSGIGSLGKRQRASKSLKRRLLDKNK